jgi:putative ABC transport system substrate-binding protein
MWKKKNVLAWLGIAFLLVGAVGIGWAGSPVRPYRVAVFTSGLTFVNPVLEGLQEELERLGYVAGKNLDLFVENTHGPVPDLVQRAARLAAGQPDVLVTVGTTHTTAAKQATDRIPIVFTWVGEPIRSGLIASYASSQNNLTGVSVYSGPLSGKRLELLHEIAPGIRRILAVVATRESIAENAFRVFDETAKRLDLQVLRRDVTTREEIEQAVRDTPPGAVDAIYHVPSALVGAHMDVLIQKAMQDKLPLVVHEDTLVEQGALASYGANSRLLGGQVARLVAKVLKGERPADLPIQTPDKLLLALNLSTARAIGLDFPASVLERTDLLVK